MARTKGIGGLQLSGKLGNLVFVPYGDETIVRMAPEKRKSDSWSQKQQEHRKLFYGVNVLYRKVKQKFVEPIWKRSATKKHTGYNLFIKANLPAFGEFGQLVDQSLLHFSCGPLPLPKNITAKRSGDQPAEVHISWNPRCFTKQEAADDELCLVLLGDPYAARLVACGVGRGAGAYTLHLNEQQAMEHPTLFLFFRRKDALCYSDDKFFRL